MERARSRGRVVIPADLSRAGRVSSAAVTYWLSNTSGMSAAKARLIGAFLDVNPYWLETGLGSPELSHPRATQAELATIDAPDKRQKPREQPLVHSPVTLIDPDDGVPDDVVLVPESRITFSAGDGHINYEIVEDAEPFPYKRSFFHQHRINPDRVRRFPVTGDSMEPMLFNGDTILVNQDEKDVIDGKLYALRYGDQMRVKFLSKRLDGTLILRSLNPSYSDEVISADVANEHITIIGRVRDKSGTGGL